MKRNEKEGTDNGKVKRAVHGMENKKWEKGEGGNWGRM